MEAEFRGVLDYYEKLLSRQPYVTGNVTSPCVLVLMDTDTLVRVDAAATSLAKGSVSAFESLKPHSSQYDSWTRIL